MTSSTLDFKRRMHIILITPFTLLLLIRCSDAYPWLHRTQEKTVAKDLQLLSLSYQHCHAHIVLFDSVVVVHGLHSPYTVTRIREKVSSFASIEIGSLAYPQMRHMIMIDRCQATFQVLPSKGLFYELAKAYKRGEPRVRPDNGAWYMLNHRFSFLIVNYMARFRDTTAFAKLGGNFFVVLKYEERTNVATGTYNSLESVTVICEYCLKRKKSLQCSTVPQCLQGIGQAYEVLTNDGRTVKWAFLQSPAQEPTVDRPNPRCFYCTRPEDAQNGHCTLSLRDAVLNYVIAGSLNVSQTIYGYDNPDDLTSPMISWSEDSTTLESVATTFLFPLILYPMISPNESVTSLKFITADGVHPRIPHLEVYSQPLDLGTWVASLGLFIILVTLMTTTVKSDNPTVSGGKVMQWGLFWVYSVLLDQVEFPLIPKVRAGFRAFISFLLVVSLVLSFVINNVYKSVLNINYVTGNELVCPWSRLDQLINFSTLYIPIDACTWKLSESVLSDETENIRLVSLITQTCGDNVWREHCREMKVETLCLFHDELVSAFERANQRGRSCLDKVGDILEGQAADDTSCFGPRIISLLKYLSMIKLFTLPELENVVKNQMTQIGTALLVTERMFLGIWEKFEKAMEEDSTLKFSHNYLSDSDTTLFFKQRSRLLVASRMPEPYTRLVTDRVHSILTSGTWEYWNSLSSRRMAERKFERRGLPASTPISMNHDSMHVLLLMTGALTAFSIVSFVGSVCLIGVSKTVLPIRLAILLRKPMKVRRLPSNTHSHCGDSLQVIATT